MGSQHQRIGLHVSAAGGVANAPENARVFGAECFQFFSRSPRGGRAPVIADEEAALFRARCQEYGFESYIHTPYYINFASKNNKIYHGSIGVVREELERGTRLGVKYVMTHMGSARDHGETTNKNLPTSALKQAIKGLQQVFADHPPFTTELLLEISAGAGAVLGDTFEELAALLDGLGRRDVNVCLDTCHLFASGYDLRTPEALQETMRQFRKTLGSARLKLVHVNDSKTELGSHRDRHEHIGRGLIGRGAFQELLHHPDFQKVNFILETKHDQLIDTDIALLKKLRKS
ncbi:MAG: deoxyribonuclease IV [Candidatus Andersenbacteria bacterium]